MVHYSPFAIGDDAGNLPSSGGGGLGDSVAGIAIKHLQQKQTRVTGKQTVYTYLTFVR